MSPSTVLIVSAEPTTRDLYVRTLAGQARSSRPSAGSEALERMRNAPADLVITGGDAARHVGARPVPPDQNGDGGGESAGHPGKQQRQRGSVTARMRLSTRARSCRICVRWRALCCGPGRPRIGLDDASQGEPVLRAVGGGSFELDREWRILAYGGAFSESVAERSAGRWESLSGMRSRNSGKRCTRRSIAG